MKKIVAVMWHNPANRLRNIQSQTNEFTDLVIYSTRNLADGKESLERLKKDIPEADLLLFHISNSDNSGLWSEIESFSEQFPIPLVCIGSEFAAHLRDRSMLDVCARCDLYSS